MKKVVALGVLAVVGAVAGQAAAQTVEYIALPSGFVPNGLSGDGSTVVGFQQSGNIPYIWTEATGLVRLYGPLGEEWVGKAWACNEDGSAVVGTVMYAGAQRPFRWTAATGIVPLAALSYGNGYDISNDGLSMAGDASVVSSNSGFYWDSVNGAVDLSNPSGTGSGSITCMSGDGRYVVGSGSVLLDGYYVRWDMVNNTTDVLTLLDGTTPIRGLPRDCSYDGDIVVGEARNIASPGSGARAIMWTSNGLQIIGVSGDMANAVSGDGSVVGGTNGSTSWIETTAISRMTFASYLSTYHGFTDSVNLNQLQAISDDGLTIMGGYTNSQGWIVRLPLPALSDFNRDNEVSFTDLEDFYTCFEGQHILPRSSADINRDGFTDFFDLIEFFDRFDTGR